MSITNNSNVSGGNSFTKGNVLIGEVKSLDIETLLTIFLVATKATDRNDSVSIDANTLQRMAKELILTKSANYAPTVVSSETREMKMPGVVTQLCGAM